jgi:hypothetical protein
MNRGYLLCVRPVYSPILPGDEPKAEEIIVINGYRLVIICISGKTLLKPMIKFPI